MTFLTWLMNPRHAQAPADAPAGAGGEVDEVEEVDDADGAGDAPPAAAGKDEKPPKPAPEKKGAEKQGAEKADKGKKGDASDKPAAKKTLLGSKNSPAAGADDAAAGKGKAGEGDTGGDELDAWKPELADGVKVDEELLGEAKTWAKQHGLKGEQLQGVVELGVKMQQKVTQALLEAHEAHVGKLTDMSKADKEIGGGKLEAAIESANRALVKFGGDNYQAIVDELERTGLGSHPAMIKMLAKIEKATRDDDTETRVAGGKTGAKGATPMEKFTKSLYPKMQKELAKERGEDVDDDE